MEDRTELGIVADMMATAATQHTVRGVKGPSPLLNLPAFNIAWSFNPDYIHCALPGVAHQFAGLWFSCVGEEYYIGDPTHQLIVSKRLCDLKPLQCFN
ncbi:hypothetical protein HPB47_007782 [Ixodes persulcatus]|uniref:Uncharacterized protein n=1 Tax=Ixodes persulcatus TaxID=34615 RepID=A0AC60P6Z2_IXOPE|nr:hypothetical protein HPB47_007782 [Ixodes persulcatus]